VVNARAPLGEEFSNRAVGREWGQQLDFGLPKGECHDAGAIGGFSWVWRDPENVAIKSERGLQVGYGNAHMGNAGNVGQTSLHWS
jgi:hypothetical protein